jgi:hypothetical protein
MFNMTWPSAVLLSVVCLFIYRLLDTMLKGLK